MFAASWTMCVGLAVLVQPACKSSQLTSHGTDVAVLSEEPLGCEPLGEVVGYGGGVGGGYVQKGVLSESANNRARNEAAELGATHVVLEEPLYEHGSGTAVTRNQQPALGHGDSSAAYAEVRGVAYKCAPGTLPTVDASGLPAVQNPPASISLAPLGTLTKIVVYQRNPATPGTEASEVESLKVEDPARVAEVASSLEDLALDPIKYVPTHRVEFVGDLGTQSLLYGFGYLQYAGKTYRLTTGAFERELGLVEPPPEEIVQTPERPEVQMAPPPTAGGESP
ncbi:MAG: DUF4156 domain-containing protein [Myxococcota bacterium]